MSNDGQELTFRKIALIGRLPVVSAEWLSSVPPGIMHRPG